MFLPKHHQVNHFKLFLYNIVLHKNLNLNLNLKSHLIKTFLAPVSSDKDGDKQLTPRENPNALFSTNQRKPKSLFIRTNKQ